MGSQRLRDAVDPYSAIMMAAEWLFGGGFAPLSRSTRGSGTNHRLVDLPMPEPVPPG